MSTPSVDLTAAYLPVYGEPGRQLSFSITVPSGSETGTWTARVWRDDRRSALLLTITCTVNGLVVTPTWTAEQADGLIPTGGRAFTGWWEMDRTVDGVTVPWLKGPFVLDPRHRRTGDATPMVTVVVVDSAVTVSAGALSLGDVETAIGATALAGLSDVAATAPTDGQALVYDTDTDTWGPGTIDGGASLDLPLGVAQGGTGAGTVALARDALGVLAPGAPGYEGLTLRTWRAAWANRRAAPANVLILGDSNSVGYFASAQQDPWVRQLVADLCAANGQRPDVGYVPRHSLTNYLHTWTTSGTATEFSTSGLGYAAVSLAAGGGYTEVTETCDRFWVRYTGGTLIGAFTVTVDGGSPVTVPFEAGTITGGRTWDSGPLTRGSHTVRITASDASFPCRLEGIYFFDGNGNTSGSQGMITAQNSQTGTGLRVWNGAKFGTRAGHFAASSATTWWTDNLDKVNPHLVVLAWITNEITAGTSAAQYKTDMAAVVAQINTVMAAAGRPTPSYLVVVPHGTGASESTITAYRTAAYEVAATIGAAVVDRSSLAGYVGTSTADVWGLTTPLDGSSRVHLSTQGHRAMGEHVADYLLRAGGRRPAGVDDSNLVPAHQLPAATTSTQGALSATDKAKLDGIEAGATADQSASEILTAVKTVDGSGSGLDADLLDGQEAAAFALDNAVVKLTGNQTIAGTKTFSSAPAVPDGSWAIADTTGLQAALDGKQAASSELDDIAALTPDDGDVLVRSAGAWTAAPPAGGGGGGTITIARAYVTAGDITLPNTAGSWALLSGIPELSIAAAEGDEVEISVHAMRSFVSTGFLDVAVVTGGGPTVQRYLATGTSTPALEGDPGWYAAANFMPQASGRSFTVEAGDLDGGNVRLRVAVKAAGSGTLYASTNYPFYWQVKVFPQ